MLFLARDSMSIYAGDTFADEKDLVIQKLETYFIESRRFAETFKQIAYSRQRDVKYERFPLNFAGKIFA